VQINECIDHQGLLDSDIEFCRKLDADSWHLLKQMIEKEINCPLASSAGRLFSAVSALVGLCQTESYESQSAIMLEAAATEAEEAYSYEITRDNDMLIIQPGPMFA